MKLILEAIKSLFRKLENTIKAETASVTVKVANLTKRVTTAQNTANTAKKNAATAQTAANSALNKAEYVMTASVEADTATVTNLQQLDDGKVYSVFVTEIISIQHTSAAKIKVGNTTYPIYSAVSPQNYSGMGSTAIQCASIFRPNEPFIVLYSEKAKAFYCLHKFVYEYVRVDSAAASQRQPYYIYGTSGSAPERFRYMRVRSSTSGSEKLFDIQVDDSGTITAVEVTE